MSEATMSREDEIRARVEKATKGPWSVGWEHPFNVWDGDHCIAHCGPKRDYSYGMGSSIANADFIAHAREDVPYLQDQLDMYKKLYDHALDCVDKVFQDYDGQKAMLPDFMRLGESKFQGVIKLAEEYKKRLAENERLRRENEELTRVIHRREDEIEYLEGG